jgi:lipopolysaccharide exporter
MNEKLGARARSGIKLTFAVTIVSGLVQAMLLVTLARMLDPLDYGYYAAALALANVTVAMVNNVIERSLVIHVGEEAPPGALAILALLVSGVVAAATFIVCLMLATTYGWHLPTNVLAALLVAQVLNSLCIVPRVTLRRELLFRRIAGSEMASQIIGGAFVSVLLASRGWGALGLAIAQVTGSLVMVTILTAGAKLRFARVTKRQAAIHLRAAISLGRIVVLEVGNAQVPPLMLTALAGPVALGLFNRAYTLVQLPVQLLTNSMTRVMISALVNMVDDEPRLRQGMRRLVVTASAIVSPVAFGIAGSHRAFTEVLLGSKWMAAAALMPWLAIGTWSVMMGYLFSVLSEATRHIAQKVKLQAISTTVLILGMLLYLWLDLIGAAVGMALASLTFLLLYIRLGAHILRLPAYTVAIWLTPGLAAGLSCCVASWMVDQTITASALVVLAAQITACGLVALSYYAVFHRALLNEILASALPVTLIHRFSR